MTGLILSNALTMSSREIAQLTNKEHFHVRRDIEKMFTDLKESLGGYIQKWRHPQNGQEYEEYLLDKDHVECLLTGYSAELRMRVIKRWHELEEANKADPMKALNDPETMRGLLLSYSEKVINLQNENQELKPKAEALDRIAKSDGSICITNAAKDLQIRPKDLFQLLQSKKWIFRRQGSSTFTAYQDKIQQGLLEHKITVVSRSDGSEKQTEQVRVTSKGITKLSEMLAVDTAV
ncbi:phage antirepressor KilAC domain-containing protein [Entomomonas moraniae]|nr:phage regulatory protein/antirepressor Ant [Entomomonas moraniae]